MNQALSMTGCPSVKSYVDPVPETTVVSSGLQQ